jgi:hypothetical protein
LDAITELKTTVDIMHKAMLEEVTNVMVHFSEALMVPINKIKDQILLSILKFFGG